MNTVRAGAFSSRATKLAATLTERNATIRVGIHWPLSARNSLTGMPSATCRIQLSRIRLIAPHTTEANSNAATERKLNRFC